MKKKYSRIFLSGIIIFLVFIIIFSSCTIPDSTSTPTSSDSGWKDHDVEINDIQTIPSGPLLLEMQYQETSYNLKDICFINSNLGYACGDIHWDQVNKKYSSTILKTTDGGITWNPLNCNIPVSLTKLKFIDENNGWIVGNLGVILHTSNGGQSFERQYAKTMYELRGVDFINDKEGWVSGIYPTHYNDNEEPDRWTGKILNTKDGGNTWEYQKIPDDSCLVNEIKFVDNLTGFVVGSCLVDINGNPETKNSAVIYKTADGGKNWNVSYCPKISIVFTALDITDKNNIWVCGFYSASGPGSVSGNFYHSSDVGLTWQNQGPKLDSIIWDMDFADNNKGYAVGFIPGGASQAAYRTMDGGNTWEQVRVNQDYDFFYGVYAADNKAVIIGNNSFKGITDDPWATQFLSQELFDTGYISSHYKLKDIFFIDDNTGWAVGAKCDKPLIWDKVVLKTEDGGSSWKDIYVNKAASPAFSLDYSLYCAYFIDKNHGWVCGKADDYAATYTGCIFYTEDGGITYQPQGLNLFKNTAPGYTGYINDQNITAINFTSANEGWVWGSGNVRLSYTNDGGKNWQSSSLTNTTVVSNGESLNVFNPPAIGSIKFFNKNIWIVTYAQTVFHSNNNGLTWEKLGETDTELDFKDFNSIMPVGENEIYIGGYGIGHSVDCGKTWKTFEIADNVGELKAVFTNDIKSTDSKSLWAVTTGGIIANYDIQNNKWLVARTGTGTSLNKIFLLNDSKGWAAGEYGVIIKINGKK